MAVVICRSCGRYNLAEALCERGFTCEMCGHVFPETDRPLLPEKREQEVPESRVQSKPPAPSWSLLTWYGMIRWGAGGLFCIGLGISLMVSPTFRADPKVFAFSDLVPGAGAVIVGVAMLGLVAFAWFRR